MFNACSFIERRSNISKIFAAPIFRTATVAVVSVAADVAAVIIAVDFFPHMQKITVTTR